MLRARAGIPRAPRAAVAAAANSSALPVCEPHSTTTSSCAAAPGIPPPTVVREKAPASTPSNQARARAPSGASAGSTGTSPGASTAERTVERKPARYAPSSSLSAGGARSTPVAASASSAPPVAAPPGGGPTRRSVTAANLNSGWADSGSTASLVTALTVTYSPCSSFQWNGANSPPGCTRSVSTAGTTKRPRREAISTRSPSAIPWRSASVGCTSTKGPGCSFASFATRPVFVSVCQWCGSRPVLSTHG